MVPVFESPVELKKKGLLPKGWHDPDEVRVLHRFMDGSVRESLNGVELPDTPETREFIRLAGLIMQNGIKAQRDCSNTN